MKATTGRSISFTFLCSIPLISIALAFGVGRISPQLYVPLWLFNAAAMIYAAWVLGARDIIHEDHDKKRIAGIGLLFITPWILASIFAGMGPPPFTIKGWVELAAEQQARFKILIACGIAIAFGFSLLYEHLKKKGEEFYARLGFTCIILAIPIMIITMTFWGNFIVDTFTIVETNTPRTIPQWLNPMRTTIEAMVVVWVALIYVSCIFFSISIRKTGLLRTKLYLIFSAAGFILSILPPASPEPLATINYLVGIPAVTFIIPYITGINLLKQSNE